MNTNISLTLLFKLAHKDNPRAQMELAICYRKGIGVTKNLALSQRWRLIAAHNGNRPAMRVLTVAYHNGNGLLGLEKDRPRYLYWAKRMGWLRKTGEGSD